VGTHHATTHFRHTQSLSPRVARAELGVERRDRADRLNGSVVHSGALGKGGRALGGGAMPLRRRWSTDAATTRGGAGPGRVVARASTRTFVRVGAPPLRGVAWRGVHERKRGPCSVLSPRHLSKHVRAFR
jgi:hypothetical protein